MATFGIYRAGNGAMGCGLLSVPEGLETVPWAVGWWATFGICRAGNGAMGLQEFHANSTLSAGSGSCQNLLLWQ